MRLIDADTLIAEMQRMAGCETCYNYNEIRCRSCQWDDAITTVDDYADKHSENEIS